MDRAAFGIFNVVRDAYLLVWRARQTLLKAAAFPLLVQFLSVLAVKALHAELAWARSWLIQLPASVFLAWFSFVEVRLLLLGEDPEAAVKSAKRRNVMEISILINLLFNMSSLFALMMAAVAAGMAVSTLHPLEVIVAVLLIYGVLWSLRFAFLPLLAAISYPFERFLLIVEGPLFSLRLLGLFLSIYFPIMIALMPFAPYFSRSVKTFSPLLGYVGLAALSACLTVLSTSLLTAAGVSVLKRIIGDKAGWA